MKKGFFTLLVAGCAIGLGIGLSLRPWHVYVQQKRSTTQQVTEMKRVEAEHVKDVQQDADIESSAGREKVAREAGYHEQGEQSAQ